jgi:hypothetical protein
MKLLKEFLDGIELVISEKECAEQKSGLLAGVDCIISPSHLDCFQW